MSYIKSKKSGASLVEVVIASSIISLTLVTLVTIYSLVARYSLNNVRNLKATALVEEEAEVLGFLRDSGWTRNIVSLSNNTTYRLYWNGTSWVASTTAPLLENRYDVTFILYPVYRNASFNVVTSGGTLDTGSRKAVLTVSWRESHATTTKTAEVYLFNIANN